jgi:diguanylate cyclase (GGDEF)-like protein
MCNTPPELDLVGVPEEVSEKIKGVLISPLIRENGAFGAITLYSTTRASYTTEHVRLLESVSQHASIALNNAITFEKTKESALTDPLTELPNARAFHHALEQRLAECQRLNREPVSVLCMDLDDFKRVNDTHGHQVGDEALRSFAQILATMARDIDLPVRLGGEEFAVLLPDTDLAGATQLAERLRLALESAAIGGAATPIRLTASFGVSAFPAAAAADDLLTDADRRLYDAKRSGKNRVVASTATNAVRPT